MNIGYACLTLGIREADFRSCMKKNANDEKLIELIAYNLNSLENIIEYNIRNQIILFRISSDLIPFGSSPVNRLPWWDLFEDQFIRIGKKLKTGGIRVSMHPGQYTVLNSPDEFVVAKAIDDLVYHGRVLDSLCTNTENKIILHIGGVYGDKEQAIRRFEVNYRKLDLSIKRRLVIENDDKSYTTSDALRIGTKLGIPVVFDHLHHWVNPCEGVRANTSSGKLVTDDGYWIEESGKTWRNEDGRQKIHYSQQDTGKRPGSHSSTIYTDEFLSFFQKVKTKDIDIMLEVKDKNLSAVKCRNLISTQKEIKDLELEWSRYKYAVLEHSPSRYKEIRTLLRQKSGYPATEFYQILEESMKQEPNTGNSINAGQHVWGYFRDIATEQEKINFLNSVEECQLGKSDGKKMKRLLWKLTQKYREPYLLNSYYFMM